MSTYRHGRHELGQNFLTDSTVIDAVVGAVENTHGPIVEIGAGDGALTLPLQQLDRPITAIEIDPTLAQKLRARTDPDITTVEVADFLRFSPPGPRTPSSATCRSIRRRPPSAGCSAPPVGPTRFSSHSGRSLGAEPGSAAPR